MTSQPALSSIVSAMDHTERATPLALEAVLELEPYWEAVRTLYGPFESGLRAPTGRLYRHEIPGGQLSNLRQQAIGLGLGERFEEVELAYARADALLGHIVKVTPTSKVVGDLALFAVSGGIDWDELRERPQDFDLPGSVLGFLRGELGEPAGGLPQPFARRALRRGGRRRRRATRRTTTARARRRRPTPRLRRPAGRARGARALSAAHLPRPGQGPRAGASSATATCPSSPPRASSTACATGRSSPSTSSRASSSSSSWRRSASPTSAACARCSRG